MSNTIKMLRQGGIHSLTGLGLQILIAGLLVWLIVVKTEAIAWHVLWSALAGLIVWLHLIVTHVLLMYAAQIKVGAETDTAKTAESGSTKKGRDRANSIHRVYQRFAVPILEVAIVALLVQSMLGWLTGSPSVESASKITNLLRITLYSVSTLILIIASAYFNSLVQTSAGHLLKCGRNFTLLMLVMFGGLVANACCGHFGPAALAGAIGWGFIMVNTLLAAEVILTMTLRLFAPRKPDALPRPAFDFYLLEGLSQPLRMGQTFTAMLESIFGFDITRTTIGNASRALIVPAVFVSAVIFSGLSTIIIVAPYEQALVLTLGRLNNQPLDPGIHFKLPWPLAAVQRYNIAEIRRIHVGSHKPAQAGGTVYREGVPILWTNMHGLNIDELLICSSPQDLIEKNSNKDQNQNGSRKVPSVSLAAADVQVQFVIDDLVSYAQASADPDQMLRKIAETCASRFIYQHDIDALFCEARLSLVTKITQCIQKACNARNLGIKIVHVAITAVHPPVEVASAFEETIAALQERETKIQHARQSAVRTRTETTGTTDTFAQLAALADGVDSGHDGDVADHDRLLHASGGEVSKVLTEAEAYRFSRENMERGKTERFDKRLRAYSASPQNYRHDQYYSILEKGLASSRKVVLLGNKDETIVRMGIGEGLNLGLIPEESGF